MTYLFPIIQFTNKLLELYSLLLIVWIVLNIIDHFDIINRRHILVLKLTRFLEALFNPPLKLIRKIIPTIGGVDISSIILYLLITLVRELLFRVSF
jgi:YggT family protein